MKPIQNLQKDGKDVIYEKNSLYLDDKDDTDEDSESDFESESVELEPFEEEDDMEGMDEGPDWLGVEDPFSALSGPVLRHLHLTRMGPFVRLPFLASSYYRNIILSDVCKKARNKQPVIMIQPTNDSSIQNLKMKQKNCKVAN